jgi:uncharacterized protein involved in response to NO
VILSALGQAIATLPVEATGISALALGLLLFVLGSRVFESPKFGLAEGPYPFRLQLRVSYGFLILFVALSCLWTVYSLANGFADRGLIEDGMRHAFATGYLLLLIVTMLGRLLPVFTGRTLQLPKLLALGAALLALGALARQLEVIALLLGSSKLLRLSAFSGDVSIFGLLISIVPILLTLGYKGRHEAGKVAV